MQHPRSYQISSTNIQKRRVANDNHGRNLKTFFRDRMKGMPLSITKKKLQGQKSQYVYDVSNKMGRQERRFIFDRRNRQDKDEWWRRTQNQSALSRTKKKEKKTRPEIPAPNTQKRKKMNLQNESHWKVRSSGRCFWVAGFSISVSQFWKTEKKIAKFPQKINEKVINFCKFLE